MATTQRTEQWYGRREPPASTIELRAGPLSAVFDAPDLRHVRIGSVELAQRIYMAVRDNAWNTIPGRLSDVHVDRTERSFAVNFTQRHQYQAIDFEWHGAIRGTEDGRISCEMDGAARSSFQYAKIGLLVHHPLQESIGRPYRARTPAGEIRGELPVEIVPQRSENGRLTALFPEYDFLAIDLPGGGEVRFDFEGDLWEMQDHRNWTDANFKSYGTPMSIPFPFDAEPGKRIWQRITVSAVDVPESRPVRTDVVRISVEGPLDRGLPPIGFGMASHGQPLTGRELDLLRRLRPDHVRADVRVDDEHWVQLLSRALDEATRLDTALELALHLPPDTASALDRMTDMLAGVGRVARVLVFEAGGFAAGASSTPAALVQRVRDRLRTVLPAVPVGGGSNLFFAEINRDRPDPTAVDVVAYGLNPQVHASDDMSLVENLEAQAASVDMARTICPGRPIIVSPITWIGSNGPYPAGPPASDGLPGNVDVRQASLFGAAWTAGSVKYLAESGADAVTYFETTGWLGLVEREDGAPRPDLFPSHPGMVFPLYHVFADLAEWRPGHLLGARSNDPLAAIALAVRSGNSTHLLVANLSHDTRNVVIAGLPAGRARWRSLDDESFVRATSDPIGFRELPLASASIEEGGLRLELSPLATARVDLTHDEGE